jgi:hypothetical protein
VTERPFEEVGGDATLRPCSSPEDGVGPVGLPETRVVHPVARPPIRLLVSSLADGPVAVVNPDPCVDAHPIGTERVVDHALEARVGRRRAARRTDGVRPWVVVDPE